MKFKEYLEEGVLDNFINKVKNKVKKYQNKGKVVSAYYGMVDDLEEKQSTKEMFDLQKKILGIAKKSKVKVEDDFTAPSASSSEVHVWVAYKDNDFEDMNTYKENLKKENIEFRDINK